MKRRRSRYDGWLLALLFCAVVIAALLSQQGCSVYPRYDVLDDRPSVSSHHVRTSQRTQCYTTRQDLEVYRWADAECPPKPAVQRIAGWFEHETGERVNGVQVVFVPGQIECGGKVTSGCFHGALAMVATHAYWPQSLWHELNHAACDPAGHNGRCVWDMPRATERIEGRRW